MEVKHSRPEPTSDGSEQFFNGKVLVALPANDACIMKRSDGTCALP
jgi:hypothetical protein